MLLPSVRRAELSGDCSTAFSDEGPLSVVFAILGGLPAAPNLARFRAQVQSGCLIIMNVIIFIGQLICFHFAAF